jgi:hypothetical protein
LDEKWEWAADGRVHGANDHTGDLACDNIIRDAIGDGAVVWVAGEEVEEIMVDGEQVFAMLIGVF